MKKLCLMSFVLAFIVFAHLSVFGQENSSSYDSFLKARKIVFAGINAIGGYPNIDKIQNFTIIYREFGSSLGQDLNPDMQPIFLETGDARLIYDAKTGFSRNENNLQRRGRLFNPVIVIKGDEGFFYWPETNELDLKINVNLIKNIFGFRNVYPQKLMPHLILQSAIKTPETLRWIGQVTVDGKKNDVVTFVESGGSLMTLYFSSESVLLTKTEEIFDDFIQGDAVGEIFYEQYQDVNGVKFPKDIKFKTEGEVAKKFDYRNISVNTNLSADLFEPPKDVAPSEYPKIFTPQKLADDVYFVPLFNGTGISYNSMFVVFDEYVLVLDSPLSDLITLFYSGLIHRVAPNKPIRYIVPTHYHIDHSGGIKKFALDGATIVTTKGNKNFFEDIIALPRKIKPANEASENKINFEIVVQKKVFKDNNHIVELYDVGPNSHADEILIAYLPKENILYVTDLFWGTLTNHLPPARETLIEFVKKLDELGLEPKIIAPGHGKVSTIEDLKKAAAMK